MFWTEFDDSFLTKFDEGAYMKAMRSEAYEEGYKEGYREGYEEGYKKGREQAEKSYSLLISALMEMDRIDDLKRATTDNAFRQQLFHEFGIDKYC